MIDIVKRLDRLANAEIIPLTTAWEIAKVASKEITRLREENKMAFEAVGDVVKANDDLREKNEKLRIEVMSDYNEGWEEGLSAMKAENEKLRKALEGMIDLAEAANVMNDPAYDTARKTLENNND